MKTEQKTFELELKEISEEGLFTGYASTFGNIDLGGDIVDSGAFKKTLKESKGKVPILAHHDTRNQIGWNMTAIEDEKGLLVTGQLDLNVQKAREQHSLMKMAKSLGARPGLSIGYRTIKAEPDKTNPTVRRLKELKLLEYSVVVFPMNEMASIDDVKQQEPPHSDEPGHSTNLEPLLHSVKTLTQRVNKISEEYQKCLM